MSKAIRAILYNKTYAMPKQSLTKNLSNDITSKGLTTALLLYNENKKSDVFTIKEDEMNSLGYEFYNRVK